LKRGNERRRVGVETRRFRFYAEIRTVPVATGNATRSRFCAPPMENLEVARTVQH